MAQEEIENGELPLLTAGNRLREARKAEGLDLDEIAARTRIARRHLTAIEEERYSDLASRTYAIGFSKSYARAVGLDEDEIAEDVRAELARQDDINPRPAHAENFEPGDPARVPPLSLAWVAGLGAIAVIVVLFVFWPNFVDPAGKAPDLVQEEASVPARKAVAPAPTAAPVATVGPIVLTALEDGVWVKVSDAVGDQLFQKEMALNETYTAPADASGAVLSTARPDALKVTVGNRTIAQLRASPEILRDIPLDPASLIAGAAPPGGDDLAEEGGDAAPGPGSASGPVARPYASPAPPRPVP